MPHDKPLKPWTGTPDLPPPAVSELRRMWKKIHDWRTGRARVPDSRPPAPPPIDLDGMNQLRQQIEQRVRYVEAELASMDRMDREDTSHGLGQR